MSQAFSSKQGQARTPSPPDPTCLSSVTCLPHSGLPPSFRSQRSSILWTPTLGNTEGLSNPMLPAPQSQWGTGPVPCPRNPFPRPSLRVSGHTTWPATPTPGPSAEGPPPPSLLAPWGEGVGMGRDLAPDIWSPCPLSPLTQPTWCTCLCPLGPSAWRPLPPEMLQGPKGLWSLEQKHTPGLHPASPCFPATCRHGGAGCPLPGVRGLPLPSPFHHMWDGVFQQVAPTPHGFSPALHPSPTPVGQKCLLG